MVQQSVYKTGNGKNIIIDYYTQLLENWPKPNHRQYILTRYGETFVIRCGNKSAPPVVLLHGSSSNSAMWMADVIEYSKYYHVYSIDIIGECGLSAETRPEWKENNYANWLSDIFENLRIENAVIVACSMGGWISFDFCMKYSNKVNKMVLLTTAGISQVRVKTIFRIMLISMLGDTGFRALNKIVYGNLEIDKTVLKFASLIKQHYKPRTDLLPLFNDNELRKIKISVLFIGGDRDCFYDSNKTAMRLSENIIDVTSMILKNTGHVLIQTTDFVIDFLKNGK